MMFKKKTPEIKKLKTYTNYQLGYLGKEVDFLKLKPLERKAYMLGRYHFSVMDIPLLDSSQVRKCIQLQIRIVRDDLK